MRGTAVLVHGMWSSPADWRWVAERLRDNDVEVLAPDLPSHRTASAGLTADAAEVRSMIASARPPVVAVGWSYGCDVIHEAAAGEPSVTHLVYIAGIPNPDPSVFPQDGCECCDRETGRRASVRHGGRPIGPAAIRTPIRRSGIAWMRCIRCPRHAGRQALTDQAGSSAPEGSMQPPPHRR
jgi:pimeloyl-ACP methyl ester carboxylesterase